eukprot:7377294-Prymnesium_polylepis.3
MDSNLFVSGCPCCNDPQRRWKEQEVQRTDALGIAERRKAAQNEGRRLAGKLTPVACGSPHRIDEVMINFGLARPSSCRMAVASMEVSR